MGTKMRCFVSLIAVTFSLLAITTGPTFTVVAKKHTDSSGSGGLKLIIANFPDSDVQINPGVTSHHDSIGDLKVVGEVQNNGDQPAGFTKITGTVYDATNATVGTGFTFTDPTDVPAHNSAPFSLLLQPEDIQGADHIKLQVSSN